MTTPTPSNEQVANDVLDFLDKIADFRDEHLKHPMSVEKDAPIVHGKRVSLRLFIEQHIEGPLEDYVTALLGDKLSEVLDYRLREGKKGSFS